MGRSEHSDLHDAADRLHGVRRVARTSPRETVPSPVPGPGGDPGSPTSGAAAYGGSMDFRYLGNSGLKISEITYGNWLTHGSQVENDVATQCVRAALDARHQHLRHRRRLRQHQGRDRPRRGPQGRAARVPRDLHQGLLAHRPRRQERHRPVPQAHHGVDQRLAAAAPDRLRRPLPGPPLRHRDAARGDDAGVRRRRPPGQGALHRRQRVDRRPDPRGRHARARSSASSSSRASRSTPCSGASSRTRSSRRARSSASARSCGAPIAQGVLTGKYQPGQQPPEGSRAADEKGGADMIKRFMNDDVLTRVQDLKPVADEARPDHGAARRRLGAAERQRRRRARRRLAPRAGGRERQGRRREARAASSWPGSTTPSATSSSATPARPQETAPQPPRRLTRRTPRRPPSR